MANINETSTVVSFVCCHPSPADQRALHDADVFYLLPLARLAEGAVMPGQAKTNRLDDHQKERWTCAWWLAHCQTAGRVMLCTPAHSLVFASANAVCCKQHGIFVKEKNCLQLSAGDHKSSSVIPWLEVSVLTGSVPLCLCRMFR